MTPVGRYLFIAFIVVPVIELWIVFQFAGSIGWGPTLFLVIGISLAGAWLVKREGLGVIRRVQTALAGGKIPTEELADGAMIFFASALMLTPGFITDAIGLALLIPPIRAVLRPPVIAFFKKRIEVRTTSLGGRGLFDATGGPAGFGRRTPGFGRDVYDVRSTADADLTDITDTDPPELD